LAPTEAEQLLARRLGRSRIAAEPGAVKEIIDHCARLPLALAIAAARAATGRVPLPELAVQLRDPVYRLGLLSGGDSATDIRAVFAWSYRALTPSAAALFRLLGRHPGPDTTESALASFAARPLPEVRRLLAEILRANLLIEPLPHRFACHDLLRLYAHHLHEDGADATATTRLLDYYLHSASAADRLLYPDRDPVVLGPPEPGSQPQRFAGVGQALEWLSAEHLALLSIVDHAATAGYDRHAWPLAWTLTGYLERHRRWSELETIACRAVAAAERLADPHASALAHRALARAHIEKGCDQATALSSCRAALALLQELNHRPGQAATLDSIGYAYHRIGDHAHAAGSFRRALVLYRDLGERYQEATTLIHLGDSHRSAGRARAARTAWREALTILAELDHPDAGQVRDRLTRP
jgi:tetratricopeptide (TPR) repeat protein